MGLGERVGTGMIKTSRTVLVLSVLALAAFAAATSAQEEDLSSISAALAPRAEGLIIARCAVCHTPDLIAQQRLPVERWNSTIEKMMQWGAEITTDEAELLVRYLSARYHPGAPDHLPPFEHELHKAEPLTQESPSPGPLVGVANRGGDIFALNCQACHGTGAGGGMGPKLARNPILKHEDLFWETVTHGRGSMPAWGSMLSQQDIADVHAWLLTR